MNKKIKNQLIIFILTCISLNIIYLPVANAAVGKLEMRQIYAIAGLALIAFGLFFYLVDTIFRPERY